MSNVSASSSDIVSPHLDLGQKVTGQDMNLSMLDLVQVPIKDMEKYCNTLTHLNLSKNLINNLGLQFTRSFRQITHLNLSENKLTHFPVNMDRMDKLVHIDLSKNELTQLPEDIGICSFCKLEYLDVSQNKLERIPENMMLLSNLVYLDLSKNEISKLPKNKFDRLGNLRWFNIGKNPIIPVLLDNMGESVRNAAEGSVRVQNVISIIETLKPLIHAKEDKFEESPEITGVGVSSETKEVGGTKEDFCGDKEISPDKAITPKTESDELQSDSDWKTALKLKLVQDDEIPNIPFYEREVQPAMGLFIGVIIIVGLIFISKLLRP